MAQGPSDEATVLDNSLGPDQSWSNNPINDLSTNNYDIKNSTIADETRADGDDFGHSSASESFSNYITPSTTPNAVQHEEDEDQQRLEAVDFQENEEGPETGDHIDNDVIMTDVDVNVDADADADADADVQTDAPVGDDWNPTPEELYAIAFADDEDAELAATQEHHDEENQGITTDNDEADTQQHGEDAQGARDDPANIEADTDPQPQNPWGMSNAQLEQLIIDQHRLFGYVRDRDSAPKPFSCVCGEASMDPTGFVNLTCPDNCVRCVECLNANVRVGLESKKNYPPFCCVPIEFEDVFSYLEPNLIDRWLNVRPEFEDLFPIYCSVKECSLHLPRDLFIDDGKWALCNKCDVKTCTVCLCAEPQHKDSDACPERLDKMDKDLIKEKGWKACPQCREMIERTEGCDHMVCECGQEFCYGCGRSYQPPMPCNCHGQNQWAEEMQAEADPQRQQEILERIANGDDGGDEDDEDEDGEEDEVD